MSVEFGGITTLASRIETGRAVLVTDPLVRKLHGSDFPPCPVIEVERGESAKSLAGAEALWERFLELGVDRASTVIAIGGGSLTDLAGFAASTWMRGVATVLVPTTLLSMVDAAMGGKTGIDFRGVKNLVGTFAEPRLVLIDPNLLDTLRDTDFAAGMAEAIKHGVIDGGRHFGFLEESCTGRAVMGSGEIAELVRLSVETKTSIAARDPLEHGERRKLNLGHTFGHAVEAASGLSHGESVSVGLVAAFELALRLAPDASARAAAASARDRVQALLEGWGLPVSLAEAALRAPDGPFSLEALRAAAGRALLSDKKREAGLVRFALPRDLGDVAIVPVPVEVLGHLLEELP